MWKGINIMNTKLNTPSAIQSYLQFGVTKHQVHSMMINFFSYPPAYIDTLSEYFSYNYPGNYLKDNLVDGTLSKKGYVFMVVYHKCTPCNAMRAANIQISFRVAKSEYGLCAYALVRISSNSSHTINTAYYPDLTTGTET